MTAPLAFAIMLLPVGAYRTTFYFGFGYIHQLEWTLNQQEALRYIEELCSHIRRLEDQVARSKAALEAAESRTLPAPLPLRLQVKADIRQTEELVNALCAERDRVQKAMTEGTN